MFVLRSRRLSWEVRVTNEFVDLVLEDISDLVKKIEMSYWKFEKAYPLNNEDEIK